MVDAHSRQRILVLNPGSTSTKLAIYGREGVLVERSVRHEAAELEGFSSIYEQLAFRRDAIEAVVNEVGREDIAAVVGRGGLLRPLPGGTYPVNEGLLADLQSARYGEHASNLGAPLANEMADALGVSAFVADPVTTDEMLPEARLSGIPDIKRLARGHALNIKACVRHAESDAKLEPGAGSFVVAHLGGGISVAAVDRGRIVDLNDALHGMGPFSPERAGALPIGPLVRLAFSGEYTERELLFKLAREGGLKAYLGTNDMGEICRRSEAGDEEVRLVLSAMFHQISKEIGAMAAVLRGRVDGVVLTGGIVHNDVVVQELEQRIGFLGRLFVYPGENELRALAEAGFRAVDGTEPLRSYERESDEERE